MCRPIPNAGEVEGLVAVGVIGADGCTYTSGVLSSVVPGKRGRWHVVAAVWVVGTHRGAHTGGIIMSSRSVWHSMSGAVQGKQSVVAVGVVGAERRVQSCGVLVGLSACRGDDYTSDQHLIHST